MLENKIWQLGVLIATGESLLQNISAYREKPIVAYQPVNIHVFKNIPTCSHPYIKVNMNSYYHIQVQSCTTLIPCYFHNCYFPAMRNMGPMIVNHLLNPSFLIYMYSRFRAVNCTHMLPTRMHCLCTGLFSISLTMSTYFQNNLGQHFCRYPLQ